MINPGNVTPGLVFKKGGLWLSTLL